MIKKDQESPSCFSVAEGFYQEKVGRSIKLDIQLNLLFPEYLEYYVYTLMLFQKVVLGTQTQLDFLITGYLDWCHLVYDRVLRRALFYFNSMVTPFISNIQHFNIQPMHTTLKKRRVIKIF